MSSVFHFGCFSLLLFFLYLSIISDAFSCYFTGKQISVTSGKKLLKAVFIILGLILLEMSIFS